MYFGENNDSHVLKSLNIGHVITFNTVFSICSQSIEFYKVFRQRVSDRPHCTYPAYTCKQSCIKLQFGALNSHSSI